MYKSFSELTTKQKDTLIDALKNQPFITRMFYYKLVYGDSSCLVQGDAIHCICFAPSPDGIREFGTSELLNDVCHAIYEKCVSLRIGGSREAFFAENKRMMHKFHNVNLVAFVDAANISGLRMAKKNGFKVIGSLNGKYYLERLVK